MERLTHAREVAESQKMSARLIEDNEYIPESVDKEAIIHGNTICADEHEQFAEWLEELKQYRTIGTPEECRKSVEICKSMIERNITPEDMEEYMKFEDECIKKGFTFKSLLEARKKQTAKRLKYPSFYKGHGNCAVREVRSTDIITKEIIYRFSILSDSDKKRLLRSFQKIDYTIEQDLYILLQQLRNNNLEMDFLNAMKNNIIKGEEE